MKKILLLFLLMICSVSSVEALDYSEWSSIYPEGVDKIKIEKEVRYYWYKDTIVNEEYLPMHMINGKSYYPNDTKFSEYSSYSLDKPDMYENREIVTELRTKVFDKNELTHLIMKSFTFTTDVNIREVEVFLNNVKINYNIINPRYNRINDNNKTSFVNISSSDEVITLDLKTIYKPSDIEVVIYYDYVGIDGNAFTFQYGVDKNIGIYTDTLELKECEGICSKSIKFNNNFILSNRFLMTYYSYRDLLYKTYETNRVYTNTMYNNFDGYTKDESTATNFYRYILNDYIVVDTDGNEVSSRNYCDKHFCFIRYIETSNELTSIQSFTLGPNIADNMPSIPADYSEDDNTAPMILDDNKIIENELGPMVPMDESLNNSEPIEVDSNETSDTSNETTSLPTEPIDEPENNEATEPDPNDEEVDTQVIIEEPNEIEEAVTEKENIVENNPKTSDSIFTNIFSFVISIITIVISAIKLFGNH